jgi:hypothetical protein
MSPKQITDALFALTYEQANEYKKQQDQFCWVQYAILDPQDIPRSYTEVFEDRLEALYGAFPIGPKSRSVADNHQD